jgi:hypothetical protein
VKKITAYLLGALIGLVIIGAIFAMQSWFPSLENDLGRHKRLIEAVWFTAALFAFSVNRLRRWRDRNSFAFWTSLFALMLLHVSGVFFYSRYVQPLLVWQWIILLSIESFVVVSVVDWSTKRFREHGDQGRSLEEN